MSPIEVAKAFLAYEDAKSCWEKLRRFTVGRQVVTVDGRAVLIQSVGGEVNAEQLPLVTGSKPLKGASSMVPKPPYLRDAMQRQILLPSEIGARIEGHGLPIGDFCASMIALGAERYEEGEDLPEDPGPGSWRVMPYIKLILLDEAREIAEEQNTKIVSILRGWLLLGLDS